MESDLPYASDYEFSLKYNRSSYSLPDFLVRMCIASMIYYLLWASICYVHERVCSVPRGRQVWYRRNVPSDAM